MVFFGAISLRESRRGISYGVTLVDWSSSINSKLLLSLYRQYADVFFGAPTDDNKTELPEDQGGEETAGSTRASACLNLSCCIQLTLQLS